MSVRHEESNEQQMLIRWASRSKAQYPGVERLFHIPNGQLLAGTGAQRARRGARLRAEGLRPGVPDLFLPVPLGGYAGLFIEMKRKEGGRLSKEQSDWGRWLGESGYRFEVCHGYLDARDVIEDYYNT